MLSAGVLAGNMILLSLGLSLLSSEINGKISLTSLGIDYGHEELKTLMNINAFLCVVPCLHSLDSIFVVYLEVIQKRTVCMLRDFITHFTLRCLLCCLLQTRCIKNWAL